MIGATSSNAKADYKAIDQVSDTLKAQRGIRAINHKLFNGGLRVHESVISYLDSEVFISAVTLKAKGLNLQDYCFLGNKTYSTICNCNVMECKCAGALQPDHFKTMGNEVELKPSHENESSLEMSSTCG